jgi:hypothetical protein
MLAPALAPDHQLPTNGRLPCPWILWWAIAQHRRRGVRNARRQLRSAGGCSGRRRCEGSIAYQNSRAPITKCPFFVRRAPCDRSPSKVSPQIRPLAVVYPASNGIAGRDRCTFRSSASWLVGVLQQSAHCGPNPQLTSELLQTGRQSDVTEKQSQRLECHFGVTGMISVCHPLPAACRRMGELRRSSRINQIYENASEISQRCDYPLGD